MGGNGQLFCRSRHQMHAAETIDQQNNIHIGGMSRNINSPSKRCASLFFPPAGRVGIRFTGRRSSAPRSRRGITSSIGSSVCSAQSSLRIPIAAH
jgi:hypothetical protein